MTETPTPNESGINGQFEKYMKLYTEHKQEAFKELGVGSVFGYCAGYFTRKMLRMGVFITGGLFVATQVLSTQGYISIEWDKLEKDAIKAFDQNGDNKFDHQDIKIIYDKYINDLKYRIPCSAGFATAFLLGWRGKLI